MTNQAKFLQICHEKIHREGIDKLLTWLAKTDFYTAPASTRFHGNSTGGLCEHSLKVYEELNKLIAMYPTAGEISEETIAITALFHDICKTNFYKEGSRNVKNEFGQWVAKSIWEVDDKIPLGHGEKSCIILQNYIKLTLPEMLAIRWHMGGYDTAVKGGDYGIGRAQEITPLVTLLHVADTLSSNLLEERRD